MAAPELRLAYLFWLPSLVGVAGLHRFYLGKPLSGLLYLVTGGLFGLGTIYDGLTMPHQVRTARLSRRLDMILDEVDAAGLRLVQKHPVRFAPLLSDKVLHVALP